MGSNKTVRQGKVAEERKRDQDSETATEGRTETGKEDEKRPAANEVSRLH